MRLDSEILVVRLADSMEGLIRGFDSKAKRWRSASEDDIFTNYIAMWTLAQYELAFLSQAEEAVQWMLEQRNPGSLRWTDSTGAKSIEMTNRALIALILAGFCRSYPEIDLYVSWILDVQREHGGAWIEETKHMGGKTSYGPSLPATLLLRLIRDVLKPADERISGSLDTARDWLVNHYQRDTIWSFEHCQGIVDTLAVTWVLRIYTNCTDDPHQLKQDGVAILTDFLQAGPETWVLDRYQLLYNCLHSLALCGMGLDYEVIAYLVQWLTKRYEQYDFDALSVEPEGVRHLCGMLIAVNKALRLTEEGRHVLVAMRERTLTTLGIPAQLESLPRSRTPKLGHDVFIVHGHDEAAKEAVARFIEKLGLSTIILHEQPHSGRTIIEKFEDYSNVGFAVVLLTPDDTGGPKDRPNEAKPRARQNVIFELGYFLGKLGRNRVCALHKKEVEIPSDYQGVLYIPMDLAGAWRLKLAKEMKSTGVDIDLNRVP